MATMFFSGNGNFFIANGEGVFKIKIIDICKKKSQKNLSF